MAPAAPRIYRYRHRTHGLVAFEVRCQQTDLWVRASAPLAVATRDAVLGCRLRLESYIRHHPRFLGSLEPLDDDPLAPAIVRNMLKAGQLTGVGPMAAVAGAIAEQVVERLRPFSSETIVENGGDCFIDVRQPLTVGIFCGESSPFKDHLALHLAPERFPLAICTSSGTIGHSLSLGRADAVTVLARDAALADAAATAIGNLVKTPADLEQAVEFGRQIPGLDGILLVIGEQLTAWGNIELAPA